MKTAEERGYRRGLHLILTIYLFLVTVSVSTTPLYRGPDEPAHIIYVRSLAHLHFPELAHSETRDPNGTSSHEAHQPPLYYLIAAGRFAILEKITGDKDWTPQGTRLISIMLGLIWVVLISRLTSEFFGENRKSLYATAFAAFIPMSSYIAGVVNNDIMACVTITWALIIITRAIKQNTLTRRDALWLGVAVGLSVLSKAQGLVLALLIAVPMLIAWPVAVIGTRRSLDRDSYKQRIAMLQNITLSLVIAVLISGWWFVRNYLIYGTPVTQSLVNPMVTFQQFFRNPSGIVYFLSPIDKALFLYFWAPFWVIDQIARVHTQLCINIRLFYVIFWAAVCGLFVIGVTKSILRPLNNESSSLRIRLYGFYFVFALLIYLSVIYQTIFVDKGVLQQGRLFLPLAGALGIVVVDGFTSLIRGMNMRKLVAISGVSLLILMNLAFSYAVWFNYKFVEL